ncbi:MAG: hypothetical protein GXY45_06115, partial [Ramlibacter sp.]|nr:hypothetical protein [Ramlibacter sp.]
MSLKNITLRILGQSETPEQELQIAGGEGGIGAKGQPVRVQAVADVKYHLTDDGTGFAPENVATKRVGSDLHVAFEGASVDQPDLIIEGYYKDNGEQGYREGSDNLLVGTHENGNVYPFIPETAQGSDAVSMLLEGQQAGQVLGISEAPVPLWWLPLLAAPLLGGGGGSTPPPDHKPEITKLSEGGQLIVSEKALVDGSAPGATSVQDAGTADFTSKDGVGSVKLGGVVLGSNAAAPVTVLDDATGTLKAYYTYDLAIKAGVVYYSYELKDNVAHAAGASANSLNLPKLDLVVTDKDGQTASGSVTITIVDDVPSAVVDSNTVPSGSYALIAGDVMSNDTEGADGAQVVGVQAGAGDVQAAGAVVR